ncbi:hypothetical protein OC844_007976, partial [Tilletia horrida]
MNSGKQSTSASASVSSSSSASAATAASSSGRRREALLDDDGELTAKFHRALAYIFQKYASVPSSALPETSASASASTSTSMSTGATEVDEAGEDEREKAARGREEEESRRNAMRASFGRTSGTLLPPPPSSSSSSSSSSPSAAPAPAPTPAPEAQGPTLGSLPPPGSVLSDAALDRFAFETNGAPFGAESKAEIVEFLDVDEAGRLT